MAEQQLEQVEKEATDQLLTELESMKAEAEGQLASFEKSKESIEVFLESAQTNSSQISLSLKESQKLVQDIGALVTEAETQKTNIEQIKAAVESLRSSAKGDQQIVKDLAASAERLKQNIEKNTKRLDAVVQQGKNLTDQIEALLPGATSVGLAKSFTDRKNEFKRPRFWWSILALSSIALLIPVGYFGQKELLALSSSNGFPLWSILEGILLRALYAGPLIWLAIHAGRHHFLAARLEEDYAYKEALSRAFEGYKREMESISETKPDSDALITLCSNTLNAMAQPPGRLFDKKHQDFTPLNVALEALDNETIQKLAQQFAVPEDNVRKIINSLGHLISKRKS